MKNLEYTKEINMPLLWDELDTELTYGTGFLGLQSRDTNLYVLIQVADSVDPAIVDAIIDAHDHMQLTVVQQRDIDVQIARADLIDVIESRIAWHEANPVTSQNAVEVLRRLQIEWVKFAKAELHRWRDDSIVDGI